MGIGIFSVVAPAIVVMSGTDAQLQASE